MQAWSIQPGLEYIGELAPVSEVHEPKIFTATDDGVADFHLIALRHLRSTPALCWKRA